MLDLTKKRKRVIKRPIITAKSTDIAQNKCYTFEVDSLANKYQIAEEFAYLFEVKAEKVNTSAIRKHKKRKRKVRERDTKKAFILTKETIDLFPKL